ncbi:hypothetical protein PUNSTDRAFT_146797 [Punctularia strigosozonata HHB-11173 SS5]|uniref:THUMP domain-containing protein n=1 Tax=Punctularia strigosozonata (strain HHB-11173) TaxID=741275 RepID=R7S2I5_PUNST|nr:uncharacterized protein PUNSTDRAFT_146797 [Punctularia strigosozonata HHB-11173 SS5]EIN04064.1 hypothetical protein PUNSTDRAFT_146797 [Punctularia strigosozonata HHB-11173 SS5]
MSASPRTGGDRRKRKYRSDGTPIWSKRTIDGPGVWVTCVKGKEKQAVGELYDLFQSLASELWPEDQAASNMTTDDDQDRELDIEQQIAQEIAAMKKPRKEQRFANCQTNTPCLLFIGCKAPVDPVTLITTHIQSVQRTGVTRARHCHRFTPVSNTVVANLPEIRGLCERVVTPFFEGSDEKYKYKIELRTRNHTTLARPEVIKEIASCVPEGHVVDLEHADVFILVEIFKSVCGISVVRDYYAMQKFNVMEIANVKRNEDDSEKMDQ